MKRRGYHPDLIWENISYRGSALGFQENWANESEIESLLNNNLIYLEHNDNYLKECLDNLRNKGIIIDFL